MADCDGTTCGGGFDRLRTFFSSFLP